MYKDTPHEGFEFAKYARSVLISATIAPLLYALGVPLVHVGDALVLFGMTYVMERALTEFWKTFLREEDQSKYFIPMRLAVFGKVVHSKRARWTAGVVTAFVALALAFGAHALQESIFQDTPAGLVCFLPGRFGGRLVQRIRRRVEGCAP